MSEIILSAPRPGPGDGERMSADLLESILALYARSRRREVTLHADWSAAPVDPAWLAELLVRLGFRATIACLPEHALEELAPLWESAATLSLVLPEADAHVSLPERLPQVRRAEVFVALRTPSEDVAPLLAWLDRCEPRPVRARLGVGWLDELSGPQPLDEEQASVWAASIEALVRELTRRNVETELACGFPLCFFSRQALGRLAGLRVVWPIAMCPLALAVGPDGLVRPCLRLPAPELFDARSLERLTVVEQGIEKAFGAYRGLCARADGLRCRSALTRACGTGCLEHELAAWRSSARRAAP